MLNPKDLKDLYKILSALRIDHDGILAVCRICGECDIPSGIEHCVLDRLVKHVYEELKERKCWISN